MSTTTLDPDNGLFPSAFATVRATWQPFVAATFLMVIADLAQDFLPSPLPFAAFRALVLIIAGFAAYRALLSRGRIAVWTAAATETGRVPWRYAGIMLIILAPTLFLGVIWTAPGGIADTSGAAASHAGATIGGVPVILVEIGLAPVLMIAYTVTYVLLGTALPETVERGEAPLRRTVARGWANYRRIALGLMFGPWLFRASMVVIIVMAGLAGFSTDFLNDHTGVIEPWALIPMMIFASGHVFAEVLTAVVLVRAYRRF